MLVQENLRRRAADLCIWAPIRRALVQDVASSDQRPGGLWAGGQCACPALEITAPHASKPAAASLQAEEGIMGSTSQEPMFPVFWLRVEALGGLFRSLLSFEDREARD